MFENRLKSEIEAFIKLVKDRKFVLGVRSAKDFWFSNHNEFRKLADLALHLPAILSSTAFIERFYSICGILGDDFPNMSDELFETRAMMKANLDTLKEMRE